MTLDMFACYVTCLLSVLEHLEKTQCHLVTADVRSVHLTVKHTLLLVQSWALLQKDASLQTVVKELLLVCSPAKDLEKLAEGDDIKGSVKSRSKMLQYKGGKKKIEKTDSDFSEKKSGLVGDIEISCLRNLVTIVCHMTESKAMTNANEYETFVAGARLFMYQWSIQQTLDYLAQDLELLCRLTESVAKSVLNKHGGQKIQHLLLSDTKSSTQCLTQLVSLYGVPTKCKSTNQEQLNHCRKLKTNLGQLFGELLGKSQNFKIGKVLAIPKFKNIFQVLIGQKTDDLLMSNGISLLIQEIVVSAQSPEHTQTILRVLGN